MTCIMQQTRAFVTVTSCQRPSQVAAQLCKPAAFSFGTAAAAGRLSRCTAAPWRRRGAASRAEGDNSGQGEELQQKATQLAEEFKEKADDVKLKAEETAGGELSLLLRGVTMLRLTIEKLWSWLCTAG